MQIFALLKKTKKAKNAGGGGEGWIKEDAFRMESVLDACNSKSPILPAKVHPGPDTFLCIFETPFANNPFDFDCIYFFYLKRMES